MGMMGCYFWIQNELDIHSKEVRILRNTYRAVIEVYSSAHGNEEFWYSNSPDVYLLSVRNTEAGRGNLPVPCPCAADTKKLVSERGHDAYREVLVKIDGNLVGSVVQFPVIFTGRINPLFADKWRGGEKQAEEEEEKEEEVEEGAEVGGSGRGIASLGSR